VTLLTAFVRCFVASKVRRLNYEVLVVSSIRSLHLFSTNCQDLEPSGLNALSVSITLGFAAAARVQHSHGERRTLNWQYLQRQNGTDISHTSSTHKILMKVNHELNCVRSAI
jgi:hypothetical protein